MFDALNTAIGYAKLPAVPVGDNPVAWVSGLVINLLIGVGFTVSFLTIAWSGISYINSGGEPKAVQKSWDTFLWGTFAAIICIAVLALKLMLFRLLGVQGGSNQVLPEF